MLHCARQDERLDLGSSSTSSFQEFRDMVVASTVQVAPRAPGDQVQVVLPEEDPLVTFLAREGCLGHLLTTLSCLARYQP